MTAVKTKAKDRLALQPSVEAKPRTPYNAAPSRRKPSTSPHTVIAYTRLPLAGLIQA